MSLLMLGNFHLHSGEDAAFKIDCDALADSDLECAAYLLTRRLPPFGQVEGVPTGGLRLVEYMRKYVTEGPLLIVDDVATTGASLVEHASGRRANYGVIFSRTSLPGVISLFQLSEEL